LHLAATESESGVEATLKELFGKGHQINFKTVEEKLLADNQIGSEREVEIAEVDLSTYDDLLESSIKEVANG
jgi:hypothetical protein